MQEVALLVGDRCRMHLVATALLLNRKESTRGIYTGMCHKKKGVVFAVKSVLVRMDRRNFSTGSTRSFIGVQGNLAPAIFSFCLRLDCFEGAGTATRDTLEATIAIGSLTPTVS
jgi:hypothetical protein